MQDDRRESKKSAFRGISDVVLTAVPAITFAALWLDVINPMLPWGFLSTGNYLMIGVYAVLVMLVVNTFGGYKIGVQRISICALSQGIAIVVVDIIQLIISVLMMRRPEMVGRVLGMYIVLAIVQAILMLFVTYISTKIYRMIFPPYNMLMINGDHVNFLSEKMNRRNDKYSISGQISCDEDIDVIKEKIKEYDAVVINDVPSEKRGKLLKLCFETKTRVYFTPKISDIIVKNSDEINIFDTPLYLCKNVGMTWFQRGVKRAGDIFISLVGIIITSPIMLITAILIHSYDKGPVFYKQTRVTIDNKPYQIMKFRSMITDAEKDGKARLASENDSRITPIGKFIRATRIDELPQFFNILKGDMSVVGPRPERPEIMAEYVESVPEFAYRTKVKAGLTGYAQVYGKYNTTSYDKLKMDLIYVEKCSIFVDIQLILMTLRVILTKDATEGVEEGRVNANVSGAAKNTEEQA